MDAEIIHFRFRGAILDFQLPVSLHSIAIEPIKSLDSENISIAVGSLEAEIHAFPVWRTPPYNFQFQSLQD